MKIAAVVAQAYSRLSPPENGLELEKARRMLMKAFTILATIIAAQPAVVANAPQPSSDASPADACEMSRGDAQWLNGVLTNWRIAERDILRSAAKPLPQLVLFDARCTYLTSGDVTAGVAWKAAKHSGTILLPNAAKIPAGPNASNIAVDGRNVLVMSLPSIWQPLAPRSEIPLEYLLESIMFHELAHAYQSTVSPSLSFPALQGAMSLPEEVSDDSVQQHFNEDDSYRREYESEQALLDRAAMASTDADARMLACRALDKMRQRRTHFFAASAWSAVDEMSLTTEGFGNWVAFAWLTRHRMQPARSVIARLGGTSWSQIEGLALFRIIDRLVPNWQSLLLAPNPETAEPLLSRACGSG